MAFADVLRAAGFTGNDIADLIEGLFVSGYSLTWASWSPSYSGSGTLTYSTVTTTYAEYVQIGKLVILRLRASGTIAGAGVEVRFSLPVTASAANEIFPALTLDSGSYAVAGGGYLQSTTTGAVYLQSAGNWSTGAGKIIVAPGWIYEAA